MEMQTAHNTKGYSLKPGEVSRHYLRAASLLLNIDKGSGCMHRDRDINDINRDEKAVLLIDLLDDSTDLFFVSNTNHIYSFSS